MQSLRKGIFRHLKRGIFGHIRGAELKRAEQHQINQEVMARIRLIEPGRSWAVPSYQSVTNLLAEEGYRSSRGNNWTRRSLYRMLQREGYKGLFGLFESDSGATPPIPAAK